MTHQNHQTNGASLEDCHTNFFALADSDAQPLVILASYSQQNSHVVLLTHKMSSYSASEATRSHRPIEVILNSPGRNVDRNAFARLVSPGRGNNFLITYILTAALGTIPILYCDCDIM
ncbi:Mediator of RNA polymerase II transcription subunit 13 [Papilio machaon]|uniref:Mediator of RNA polymerase II transcription subunit 13 n=1 Tax=Papilio machaon TaxID=76193 RepID=A0A194RP69_PAPMA|nr:Mediator of RNA polymerase II transcription subunit 13 [Papilio machaon]